MQSTTQQPSFDSAKLDFPSQEKSGQTKQSLLILKPKANMDVFPIFVKNGDRV